MSTQSSQPVLTGSFNVKEVQFFVEKSGNELIYYELNGFNIITDKPENQYCMLFGNKFD